MTPVHVRWYDAKGTIVARMLCPGRHTAEERLARAAPEGAATIRVEGATICATYPVASNGPALPRDDEAIAESWVAAARR